MTPPGPVLSSLLGTRTLFSLFSFEPPPPPRPFVNVYKLEGTLISPSISLWYIHAIFLGLLVFPVFSSPLLQIFFVSSKCLQYIIILCILGIGTST